jgi:hypothetical protein
VNGQNQGPEPPLDEQNDEVIGKAFKVSLGVFAAIGLIVAGILVGGGEEQADETVVEATLEGPVEVVAPAADPTPPALPFTDITRQAGIDFTHQNGAYGDRLLPETMGSGAAFFDYDNDGDADLLLVNGTTWPWREADAGARTRLYENDGSGTFDDVTQKLGLDAGHYGTGVAVGDVDNDGYQDVFITAVGENVLLMNRGGKFERVKIDNTLKQWRNSYQTVWNDIDNDGDGDVIYCDPPYAHSQTILYKNKSA